jgi:iron complex outermembrane receptor protein
MKFILTAIAFSFQILTLAQNPESLTQQDSLGQASIAISEVVINAPLTILKPQQWPGSVATLDSLQLQSGNAYLLANHLNSLPGVLMQQGTLNTNRITIRGIGSRTPVSYTHLTLPTTPYV